MDGEVRSQSRRLDIGIERGSSSSSNKRLWQWHADVAPPLSLPPQTGCAECALSVSSLAAAADNRCCDSVFVL